jgi:hypothetical protein
VKRTIETLANQRVIESPQIEEISTDTRPVSVYVFSGEHGKRDSIIIVAQLSPEFTARLVDRWQELEAAQAPKAPRIPQPFAEALRLAADEHEFRLKAEAQRDEAIRTKALIGGSGRQARAGPPSGPVGLKRHVRPQKLAGLSAEALRARNLRLIFVGLHGFGDGGPYADAPAYDDIVQALSGAADLVLRQSGHRATSRRRRLTRSAARWPCTR